MSESAAPDPLRSMPSTEDMCARTIGWLVADGYANATMQLGRPMLNEVGRRLMEPAAVALSVLQWIEEQGHTLPQSIFYRFVHRFRETYKLIWTHHANELLAAAIVHDPQHTTEDLQRIARDRVAMIVAQAAMTTDAAELDLPRLQLILRSVEGADKHGIERAKLALAERQAEDRAEKLAAEVEALRLKISGIPDAVASLAKRVDELATRTRRGESIPAELFAAMRDELSGLSSASVAGSDAKEAA